MNAPDDQSTSLTPVAVITGATQGIGRELANEFAKDGHAVLLAARTQSALSAAAAEITESYGVSVYTVACDLSTVEGCNQIEETLKNHGLYCESLVNNAAVMAAGFFQDQDRDALLRIVDLNVRAVIDLTRRFLPDMIERRAGGVLNVSSLEGFMPVPYQATYAATKAAIISWTRAIAYEVMGTGVRVCTVAPGPIETSMHAKAGAEYSRYLIYVPQMAPEQMAKAAYRRFMRGNWVIIEGFTNRFIVNLVRFVPGIMLIPAVGWFFRVRDAEGNLQWPDAVGPGGPGA